MNHQTPLDKPKTSQAMTKIVPGKPKTQSRNNYR